MKRKLLFLLGGAFLGGLFSLNVSAQTTWSGDVSNADGLSFTQKVGFGDLAETSNGAFEIWCDDQAASFDYNQSFNSVPDGVYELSSQAMYRASLTYGTLTNCILYATVGDKTFSTPLANFGDYTSKEDPGVIGKQMTNNNAYLNIVPAVIVEGGNVTIGMKSVGELTRCTNGYWVVLKKSTFTFKDVTATYHAKLVARANTMLATAPDSDDKTTLSNALTTYATANFANAKALQAAINTFLATATVDNPLNVTDFITNPSFADDSGNKKNWIQDLGYKQPSDIYQPTGWNMLYSSAKVNNVQYQTYKTQTDNAKDNNCYYVRQRWGDVYAVVDLHQHIKELPSGAYRLTVAVKGGSSVTDANTLTMVAGSNTNTTTVSDFDKSNYKDYSVQVVKEDANSDIDISFGWNQKTGNEQLYYVDDFRLYYLGDPVKAKKAELQALQATIDTYLNDAAYVNVVGAEKTSLTNAKAATAASETVAAYETVIGEVQGAIDAFVAAKDNYDALVNENAKAAAFGLAAMAATTSAEALQAVKDQKVAEYNYVTDNFKYGVALGEWNSTGTNTSAATFNNEHWSGTPHDYKNQKDDWGNPKQGYAASSWSIDFNQNVSLPAGNYVFKVAGRQASGDKVTTSLVVTKVSDSSELGRVSDFPRSNSSRGINKNGATSFDENDSEYANDGKGYGWEWRYVKFSLAEEATVNIAISSVATAASQWVSFGNYTLQTDNEANISLIAYNIARNDAITARDNTDYTNVIGDERTALVNAIDADKGTTKESIEAATTALNNAVSAFTAAKNSYDAFVAAKAVTYSEDLPYASSTKFDAIATAQAAADATSASDATTKTNAILSAYRKYVESNALAEGVGGAVNCTDKIGDSDFSSVAISGTEAGAWTFDQTGGTVSIKSEQPFTDGNGNSSYSYFDYYNEGSNNQNIHQVISNLEPGRYLLTATARAHSNFNDNLRLYVNGKGDTKVSCIGGSGGVFDNGWNDVSLVFDQPTTADITIGMKTDGGKKQWWGVSRFRLVKIADAATMSITAAKYATFIAPFDVTIPADVTASTVTLDANGSTLVLDDLTTTISANTPVVLQKDVTETFTQTFYGESVAATNNLTEGILTGTYTEIDAPEKSYILNKIDDWVGFAKVAEGNTTLKVGANRCYIKADAVTPAPFFRLGGTTNIANVENAEADAAVYDLTGRRVDAPAKGIYIVNGKKVLVK